MKYRKKPVVIEAFKYEGSASLKTTEKEGKMPYFIFEAFENDFLAYNSEEELLVSTLEGIMRVSAGDYIIQGVNGEIYPCKPDIFEKTYEKVEK